MKLKNNKGFTGVDVAVSLVILLVFIAFISALFYNVSTTTKRIERKTQATDIAIAFIEAMKVTPFATLSANQQTEVAMTTETFKNLTGKEIEIPNGYTVKISIENPNNDVNIGQVVKIITAEVTYQLGNADTEEKVMIQTLVKNI